MSETTDYQRNKEAILNRAKQHYENKEELSRNKYRELSENEKENIEEIDTKICLKKINKD